MALGFRLLALIALVATDAWAVATGKRSLIVHERKTTIPRGFTRVGPAHADTPLTLRLALKRTDTSGLINALMRVSDPTSPQRGQFLSKSEVEAFMRPSESSVQAVRAWLSENGISSRSVSPAGDWLEFTVPVTKAGALFNAEFSIFKHSDGSQSVRTLEYSVPADLRGDIDFMFPGVSFGTPKAEPSVRILGDNPISKRQSIPAGCDSTITPACLQALYGIPTTPATQSTNVLGVSGFIQQFANRQDLASFLRSTRPDIKNANFTLQTLDGGVNPQLILLAGVEADLDIQYTVGVATKVPTTFISVGNNFQDGDLQGFLDIINFLLAEDAPPQVLTTSYGGDEDGISPALAESLCTAYAALGARGTSILFASGDGGVAGARNDDCTTFVPTFPGGCPFITTVGATTDIPETSADFSSGGFSNVFARPDYQATAVPAFLKTLGSTNAGLFNTTGRGIPDMSAMGNNVLIVNVGLQALVGGTSCSSPIFASMISLINDRLIAAGKPVLGFLNPANTEPLPTRAMRSGCAAPTSGPKETSAPVKPEYWISAFETRGLTRE
ncbi:hypothetical protein EXIGLDRAFT_712134 [Exidia glandulosa HHB12029]|uniref:tripeptidyl-peptidase II n=1 Tax=Exidia glandulosa HHB12029 TaxID=1314781 RepID=A0A165MLK2_EXIGL|nr:hypothetical protein EXIGLDRAFT_712134 [Exidia glandulosa HHB12029]